jgi:uncharacterized protein (DUF427 family)
VRIIHTTRAGSTALLAEGPLGRGITPFENSYYIRRKYLATDGFRVNYVPGLCPYKFLYVWLDLVAPDGTVTKNLGWTYWLPNPLLPFIWFRFALPAAHPEIRVDRYRAGA